MITGSARSSLLRERGTLFQRLNHRQQRDTRNSGGSLVNEFQPETLKYFDEILQTASASYLGYAAFACVAVITVLYILNKKSKGIGPWNLIAYEATIILI